MDALEYHALTTGQSGAPPAPSVGTLLYGAVLALGMLHVYQDEAGTLHAFCYQRLGPETLQVVLRLAAADVPHFLASEPVECYPECCDFAYCRQLQQQGVPLRFAAYDPVHVPGPWYGPLLPPDRH